MNAEEYQKFKQSLKETQERGAATLARITKTLEGVKDTLKDIKQNEENIDKFTKAFGDVMTQLAQKIAGSFGGNPFRKVQGKHYDHLPQEIPITQLVKRIMKQQTVLIITGAGVSAPSGIPTFRGIGGLYSKKFQWQGQQYEPQEFITLQFYQKHPQAIWNWVNEISNLSIACKPNVIHNSIDKLAKELSAQGKKVTVVTQNIDSLHLKPQQKNYEYFEVHGNVQFVRCCNFHLIAYSSVKEVIMKGKVANCSKCHEPLRPHVLFFDESYGQLYGDEVKQKTFPFVFVIGSSLSTGLCSKLTLGADEVVEINPEPVIQIGKVYQYKKDSEIVLEQIIHGLKSNKH